MKSPAGKGGIELLEEATHLLRHAPPGAVSAYAVGTLPFVLGLLYFWSDMSRSALAETRLPAAALALTAGFFWMKTWQCVFAHRLLCHWCGEPAPRPTAAALARTALHQAILQPAGLFLIPLALVSLLPLPWVYGFFLHATALGARADLDLGTLARRSWAHARFRIAESFELLALLKLFAVFVLLNVASAMAAVPYLLDAVLGVENVFTRSPWTMLNTTFVAVALGIAYLCLDPFLKCAYVLRCFYGEAHRSGADLKADLAAARQPWAAAALALWLVAGTASAAEAAPPPPPPPAHAPSTRVAPDELSQSIDEVLRRREYLWRLPRTQANASPSQDENFLARSVKALSRTLEAVFRTVSRWVRKAMDAWNRLWRWRGGGGTPGDWLSPMRVALILLVAALAGLIGWMLVRLWRAQAADRAVAGTPFSPPATPDLADENIGADQLPEDGWIRLGRELMERGELRLALRAFYLASLAHLAGRHLVTLARSKSNLDYERELARRAHAFPGLPGMFRENVMVFDRVWYGAHAITPGIVAEFTHNLDRIQAT